MQGGDSTVVAIEGGQDGGVAAVHGGRLPLRRGDSARDSFWSWKAGLPGEPGATPARLPRWPQTPLAALPSKTRSCPWQSPPSWEAAFLHEPLQCLHLDLPHWQSLCCHCLACGVSDCLSEVGFSKARVALGALQASIDPALAAARAATADSHYQQQQQQQQQQCLMKLPGLWLTCQCVRLQINLLDLAWQAEAPNQIAYIA